MRFALAAPLCALLLLAPFARAATAVQIATEDGWHLAADYEPSVNGSFVILLHDLGKDKSEFAKLAPKIKTLGFGFLALDLRGHGASTAKEGAGEPQLQTAFARTGTDNEFNQMTRDAGAAIKYLNQQGIPTDKIFIAGSGLGANVAARSIIFNPDIAGVALFTPSLKARDVLAMTGIKVNTKPVFIAVSGEERKSMMEASFIRNAAFLSSGAGSVTFVTAYDMRGVEMVDKYLSAQFLQWLQTPKLPEILPDAPQDIEIFVEDAATI